MNVQQQIMNRFYVLIGSNINPHENVKKGLDLINESAEISLEAVSSEFLSKAVGMDGDDFLNQALRCNTRLDFKETISVCLLYTSPSPRDATLSRMPSSA